MNNNFNRIIDIITPHMIHDRNPEEYTILDILDYLHIMWNWRLSYTISSTGYLKNEVSQEQYIKWERDKYLVNRWDKCLSQQYNNGKLLFEQKNEYLQYLLKDIENIEYWKN